jgi:dipeptidyl aminopeptidase/acylaminoacyl peptidase
MRIMIFSKKHHVCNEREKKAFGTVRERYIVPLLFFCLVTFLLLAGSICAQVSSELRKHAITVADMIEMTRLGDPKYFSGQSVEGRVAQFSPDGKQFVILLRKGNVQKNANEYSLFLFHTAEALRTPKPDLLVTMASSSNRDAIHGIRWSGNGKAITFVGEGVGEDPQIYSFNVEDRRLTKITSHLRGVNDYGISDDGSVVVFAADGPEDKCKSGQREGIVITSQRLASLVAGDCQLSQDAQLFVQHLGQPEAQIPIADPVYHTDPISVSPDGLYAMVGVYVRDVPREWAGYTNKDIQQLVSTPRRKGEATRWKRYLLFDTTAHAPMPFLNTPMPSLLPFVWAKDSQSVFIKCYLPLNSADPEEQKTRSKSYLPAQVKLPKGEINRISEADWQSMSQKQSSLPLKITLDEGLDSPPKIYASAPKSDKKTLLLDLNPQFRQLEFGRVEQIQWKATSDVEVTGGLYFPPDYSPGQRYPLVIQTHGFDANHFSMDGLNEWSSGFAARALAAKGFLVLQAHDFTEGSEERVTSDKSLGATLEQAYKKSGVLAYERAIDYLNSRGMIDRNKVGISGFSRTVCFVAYALTHFDHEFAAAALTDGIDCGYFQYLAFPNVAWDFDALNGGVSPFGSGLDEWLKEAPSFNFDKVRTPVRLVALNSESVLEMWEWYSALTLQKKPVDFIEIPDAPHLLQRPWDRRIAQQGLVDWFCFWLKGEKDPDPAKADQYARWRELRTLQQQSLP